jgi:HEAT repeat protein
VQTGAVNYRGADLASCRSSRLPFHDRSLVALLIFLLATAVRAPGQTDNVAEQITRLQSPDPELRLWAADALAKFGDRRAVEPLIGALHDSDPDVAALAATGLGRLGDARAVEPLIEALGSPNEELKLAAGFSLATLHDPRAIPAFLATLRHEERFTMELDSFGALAEGPLLTALHDADPVMRSHAVVAIAEMRDAKNVDALIAAFHDPDPGVRRSAAWGLTGVADPRVPDLLVQALHDPDVGVRTAVASQIGRQSGEHAVVQDPRFVGPLLENLQNPDIQLRIQVCMALGRIGDPRAVQPLIEAMKDSRSDVVSQAMQALGAIHTPEAIDALIAAAEPVVSGAIRFGQSSTSESFADANKTSYLADEALRALGAADDARAIAYLAGALQSTNASARISAAQALRQSKSPEAAKALVAAAGPEGNAGAAQAVAMLGIAGATDVEGLLRLLNDPQRRDTAIAALGRTKDPRAVEPLIALLKTPYPGTPQPYGARIATFSDGATAAATVPYLAVVQALGELGDARAVPPLIDYLQHGPVSRDSVPSALVALGSPAIGPLIDLLHDENAQTRKLAAGALAAMVMRRDADPRPKEALLAALREQNAAALAGGFQFYVSLGAPGSESALAAALQQYGDQMMAEYFLNCGDVQLEDAAREWGEKQHFHMQQQIYGVVWGKMPAPPGTKPKLPWDTSQKE